LELFFGFYIKSRVLDGDRTPLPRPPVLQKRGPDYTDKISRPRIAASIAELPRLWRSVSRCWKLIVVSTVGALCFGCGYFAAFIVTYRQIPQRNDQAPGRSL
jgi:hypothetical protein